MKTYLVTGATSGLGLEVARRLVRQADARLILPVRDDAKGIALRQQLALAGDARVSTPLLDLASLQDVARFVNSLAERETPALDGVLLNAGIQSADRLEFTGDGFETTFAVNHLANFLLMRGLVERLARGGIVGWTASGTHDPGELSARLAGFRGGRFTSVDALARGDYGNPITQAQACRDAYATSKLCEIVSARVFARRFPDAATFFSFDPGLMPGTGLAQKQSRTVQWVWHNVLPHLVPILPGASTPRKSAALLVDLLTGRTPVHTSGAYFNYTDRPVEPAPAATAEPVADELTAGSEKLLLPFGYQAMPDRRTPVSA